jgi:hypothetical protein
MLDPLALVLAVSAQWMCPAHFSPLPPGWIQGNLGPSTISSNSWAHSPGFSNLNDIGAGDIYIWTLLLPNKPSSPAPTARRQLRPPLSLRRVDQIARQEGSSLPEYRFAGRYRGYFVDVRVDFGNRHPLPAALRRAQAVLDRLRVPPRTVATPGACHRGDASQARRGG